MKFEVLARPQDFSRETTLDIHKVQKNFNKKFEKEIEYTKALNATKLKRMFAKPFLNQLEGHSDCISAVRTNPKSLTDIYTADYEGKVICWNLTSQTKRYDLKVFDRKVEGICLHDNKLIAVGGSEIKIYRDQVEDLSIISKEYFTSVDHHRFKQQYATASSMIQLWDHAKSEPITSMQWGSETIHTVKFNQTETSVLASCGSDRSVVIYDIRTKVPVSKLVMKLKTNALCWNPMEAFNFTTASEDHNCYTFDMRYFKHALSVAKGHVSAVMDIDYSPTGQEFATCSYDKTIRIFEAREGLHRLLIQGGSRDVYHTKRMQKGFSIKFSNDARFESVKRRYLLSGSDDGNLRLWKAQASDKLGTLSNREKASKAYSDALINRYKAMPEISKIDKHRRLPKAITSATKKKSVMVEALKTREKNRRKHSKPGSVPFVAERQKHILNAE